MAKKLSPITPGDVLLTIVGTIGRSAIVPDGIKPFTLQRSVAVLAFKDIVPKYMMYQLQSPFFQRHLNNVAKGTAQKGVYLRTLAHLCGFYGKNRPKHKISANPQILIVVILISYKK